MKKLYSDNLTDVERKTMADLRLQLKEIQKRIYLARTDTQRELLKADFAGLELKIKQFLKRIDSRRAANLKTKEKTKPRFRDANVKPRIARYV